MGEQTKIEWTHHTFNPWIGCTKVHTGCLNCYAEAQNGRWAYNGGAWGKDAPRKVTSDSNWLLPYRWANQAAKAGERRRVFCASLADVLDEEAPREAQERLWGLIRNTAYVGPAEPVGFTRYTPTKADKEMRIGGLDWLLLTKRPERWELIPYDVRPLVWLGTSISDQKTADVYVPRLLYAHGFAKRFLSIEPQVGPIDLIFVDWDGATALHTLEHPPRQIDWVIVGGESGPGARPFDIAWARSLRDQCADADVAFFCKQLGARPRDAWDAADEWRPRGVPFEVGPIRGYSAESALVGLSDKKGGDWSEWPEDLRVRQFPEDR